MWAVQYRRHGRMALTDGGRWPASIPGAIRQGVRAVPVAAGHDSTDLTRLAGWIATRELVPVVGSRHAPSGIHKAFESLTVAGTVGARLVEHPEVS